MPMMMRKESCEGWYWRGNPMQLPEIFYWDIRGNKGFHFGSKWIEGPYPTFSDARRSAKKKYREDLDRLRDLIDDIGLIAKP